MSIRRLSSAFLVMTLLPIATVEPHGGQYRGPGDVVPRNPRGDRPGNRPTTPTTPTPPTGGGRATPTNPNPPGTGPGPIGGGGRATGGIDLTPSLAAWSFWWEFNDDRYLALKSRIHSVPTTTNSDEFIVGIRSRAATDRIRASRDQMRERIFPIVMQVLSQADQRSRDEVSSALVALGKLGVEPERSVDMMVRFLSSRDQEIRETAAVALGILAHPRSLAPLLSLLADEEAGRKLVADREVDSRTRAFAAYGLGLVGHALTSEELRSERRSIANRLLAIVDSDDSAIQDVRIAALTGLSLLPLEEEYRTREVAGPLRILLEDRKTANIDLVRSHVPTVLARLGATEFAETFVKIAEFEKEDDHVRQSSLLALGVLGKRLAEEERRRITRSVIQLQESARDVQLRGFACIVLGQLGTDDAITYLTTLLRRGRSLYHPWAALGLGVYGYDLPAGTSVDPTIARSIEETILSTGDGDRKGAMAIALGLLRHRSSAPMLMREFRETRVEPYEGYLAIALGLMQEKRYVEELRQEVSKSKNRELRLQQLSIALGLLGDRSIVDDLISLQKEARTTAVHAAIAQALGFIGDARSVDPLVRIVEDEKQQLTGLTRAFALVALGIIGDKEDLPWNAKISENMNYRAAVPTMLGGAVGVLEIL